MKEGIIWSAFEADGFKKYDAFVGLIKDVLAPSNFWQACNVEDTVNEYLAGMFNALEEKYNKHI